MNNKGQVLVAVVLLLPLIFLIIASVTELSRVYIEKQKCEDAVITAIDYGLDNIEKENLKEKIKKLLDANIEGEKEITINSKIIEIKFTNKIKGLFSETLKDIYNIKFTYKGYFKDNKKIIIKN